MVERGDELSCQEAASVVFLELVLVTRGCSICDSTASCVLHECCTFLYLSSMKS